MPNPLLSRCAKFTRWLRRSRAASSRRRAAHAAWIPSTLPELDDDDAAADAAPRGCGWFDSSHELRTGLAVSEQLDAAASAAMPLRDWVDWQLRGVIGGVWSGRSDRGAFPQQAGPGPSLSQV